MRELQRDASQPQRDLAQEDRGLSQNACWRRLRALEDSGIIKGRTVNLDRAKLGLGLVVFVMVKTCHHSADWLKAFRQHISANPQVVDFFRIGGDYDYMLRIVTDDMASYDAVYQRLIEKIELESVTSYFAMKPIEERRPLPI